MFYYSAFGLSIASELELPGLLPATSRPEVTIMLGTLESKGSRATVLEEFAFNSDVGRFRAHGGCAITIDPAPGCDPAVLRSMLMGRVMGYLMRQRGYLPLHASAVAVDGRAAVFMGQSGMGKSTTAAAFYAAGHTALSDELSAVRVCSGDCEVLQAGTPLRLSDSSLSVIARLQQPLSPNGDKYAIGDSATGSQAAFPVAAIYLLAFGPGLHAYPIPPLQAVRDLTAHSFINVKGMEADTAAAHLRSCTAITQAVPVLRLVRERSLDQVPAMVSLVEEHCRSGRQ